MPTLFDFAEGGARENAVCGFPGVPQRQGMLLAADGGAPTTLNDPSDVIFSMEKLPKASNKGVGKESKGPGVFW